MALFEGYERRIAQIDSFLAANGIASLEEAEKICLGKNVDVRKIVKGIQNIAFENAGWAYLIGAAAAIKKNQQRRRGDCRDAGHGLAGLLHSRFRRRRSQGGHRPRQPGRHAAARRDRLLRLLRGA